MPIEVLCTACERTFRVPDAVAGSRATCPGCGGAMVAASPLNAETSATGAAPNQPDDASQYQVADGPDRVPCPMCGGMVVETARKCRFCGESLTPRSHAVADSTAADLTVGDWVFCVLCSQISCIFGLVYLLTGNPKGKKMFLVSLAMIGFWVVVRVALVGARLGLEGIAR